MSQVYSERMCEIIRKKAEEMGITLWQGVYIQLTGPAYETPAEIRMCRTWGATGVGMSTACEAMAARHMGMEVCGISCITNLASGIPEKKGIESSGSSGNGRSGGYTVQRINHADYHQHLMGGRQMSNRTKQALEASLKKLLLQKPLDKITIQDLPHRSGISRMAFYYHFKDIYDLVEWVCREDADSGSSG